MPRPEKWNKYVVNSYVRPKGLHALKKQEKLSESEQIFRDRYSKRNIGLVGLEKSGMVICSQMRKGFVGNKNKPVKLKVTKGIKNKVYRYIDNKESSVSGIRRAIDTSEAYMSQYSIKSFLPNL